MKPRQVKKYFKSGYNFHKCTGMSAASLANWLKQGYIPEWSQFKLERITNGELKAEYTSFKK